MFRKSFISLALAVVFVAPVLAQTVHLGHRAEELRAVQAALSKASPAVTRNLVTGMSPDGLSGTTMIPTVTMLLPQDDEGYNEATPDEAKKLFNAVKGLAKGLAKKPGCLTASFQVEAILSTGQKVAFCIWGRTPEGRWDMDCRIANGVMAY
jgi:hypothetical protein